MRYYRITLMDKRPAKCSVCGSETLKDYWQRGASYIETSLGMAALTETLFYDVEPNESFLIEPVELTEEEYNNAPEFTGF